MVVVGEGGEKHHEGAVIRTVWCQSTDVFIQYVFGCSQGSLLFSKFEFSIKPDLRGLSFS